MDAVVTTPPAYDKSSVEVALAGGALRVFVPKPAIPRLHELCGFASRHNPKRGFLFVSRVLGKHLPVKPSEVLRTHSQLAVMLKPHVTPGALFIGFAETATGLGAGVFEACLRAQPWNSFGFIQTTRYRLSHPHALHFKEEHSHATGHLLYEPQARGVRLDAETVVLIDDELSTGKTAVNFTRELLALNKRLKKLVLVSLVNWMGPAQKAAVAEALPGLTVQFLSLLDGTFEFKADATYACPPMPCVDSSSDPKDGLIPLSYGRVGTNQLHPRCPDKALSRLALDKTRPVHVLGDGEFMHPPLLLAQRLEQAGFDVLFQSTTRSPVLVGGAIATKTGFQDHYGDGIENFAYNLPDLKGPAQVLLCHESSGVLHAAGAHPMKTISYTELLCD